MNNFGSENMGVLLHKLTKYQTLLANCGTPAKSAIYNQKIDYYSNKLNNMGVSQNNLNGMRNLIGGVDDAEAKSNVDALEALLNVPVAPPREFVDPNEQILQQISTEFEEILKQHEQNKANLTKLQTEKQALETQNTDLTTQIKKKTEELSTKVAELEKVMAERDTSKAELEQKTQELTTKLTELKNLNTAKAELEEKIKDKESLIEKQNNVILGCKARLSASAPAGTPPVPSGAAAKLLEKIKKANLEMQTTTPAAPAASATP